MKATLDGSVIAESDDIVDCKGYQYFPSSSVRMQWLERAPKTAVGPRMSARRAILRRGDRRRAA